MSKVSIIRELTAVAKRVPTSSFGPWRRTPSSSGTFITNTVRPTGKAGSRRFKIWAMPVKPPITILLGWKNQLKERA